MAQHLYSTRGRRGGIKYPSKVITYYFSASIKEKRILTELLLQLFFVLLIQIECLVMDRVNNLRVKARSEFKDSALCDIIKLET